MSIRVLYDSIYTSTSTAIPTFSLNYPQIFHDALILPCRLIDTHFNRYTSAMTSPRPTRLRTLPPLTPTTTTALPPPFNLVTQMTSKEHTMHTCAALFPFGYNTQAVQ
jgi:hypothetical protein